VTPGRSAPPAGIPTLTEVVSPSPVPAPARSPADAAPISPFAGLVAPPGAAHSPSAVPASPTAGAPAAAPGPVLPAVATAVPAATAAPAASAVGEEQLVERVLADLQRQIELMLEARLREALAPVLSRTADTLVRDARKELTAALREAVAHAVAGELGRRKGS
jgi:hypothetical protein